MKSNTAKRLLALLRAMDNAAPLETVRACFRELPPETVGEVKAIADEAAKVVTLAELAKLSPPVVTPEQREDAIEAAYWDFDARHKGLAEYRERPQSERDAFKNAVRSVLAKVGAP